jgi:hypothetical protein
MLKLELLECPLCASYRTVIEGTKVVCLNCGCNTGQKETLTQAIAAWNERKKLESD